MIIKIWRYRCRKSDDARPRTAQTNGFDVAYGCTSYIFGIDAPERQRSAFEDSEVQADFAPDAARASEYIIKDDGVHDILIRAGHNLRTHDVEAQVKKMASLTAEAGLDYFYHYTWSHPPGVKFTGPEMVSQNRTIRRVLEAQDCPAVEATHGELFHLHGHGALLSVDEQGKGKPLAHGWFIEASHIAIAVVERDYGIKPEPLRRYIATEQGVFNLLTGHQVADRSGLVLRQPNDTSDPHAERKPDGGLMKRVREAHNATIKDNEAPSGFDPGDEWPLERYAKIVVAPRIKAASNWEEVHQFLAPLGIRYTKVGNTGRLIAIGVDGQPSGEWVGAGDAYSRAALGKLKDRFKVEFKPPVADLDLRSLTMPVYNRPDVAQKAELQRDLKREVAALESHLKADNRKRQADIRSANLREKYNEAVAQQAERSRLEQAIVHDFAVSTGARRTRSDSRRAARKPHGRSMWSSVKCIIWGGKRVEHRADTENRLEGLEKRYDVRRVNGTVQYWIRKKSGPWIHAFTKTDNLVTVLHTSRQAQIDALHLAERKFTLVRISGPKRFIAETIMLAAELGLALDDGQEKIGKSHIDQIRSGARTGLLAKRDAWVLSRSSRTQLRHESRLDLQKRVTRARSFWSKVPSTGSVSGEAHKGLTTLSRIDPNSVRLASSRIRSRQCRFIDDDTLLNLFLDHPRRLLLPEVQRQLAAIEAIQIEERRWIAGALISGAAEVEDDDLKLRNVADHWAKHFWVAQHDDPTFRRLIEVSRLRPDRFSNKPDARPDVMAWRAARHQDNDELANAIADEMFTRSETHGEKVALSNYGNYGVTVTTYSKQNAEKYRQGIFAQLGEAEVAELKRTPGKFNNAYRGEIRVSPSSRRRRRAKTMTPHSMGRQR